MARGQAGGPTRGQATQTSVSCLPHPHQETRGENRSARETGLQDLSRVACPPGSLP